MTKLLAPVILAAAMVPGWFLNLWLTPDQQGRYLFERGEYEQAADRFEDSYWKGIALYRLGRFEEAIDQFALRDSAEAYFHLGNCYAHLGAYPAALESYQESLNLRSDFPEAQANLDLMAALIEQEKEPDQAEEQGAAGEPTFQADEVQFDEKGKSGTRGEVDEALLTDEQLAEMWMRNIQTSPADFLRLKFRIETTRVPEESP